jgi:hypothetical protein
MISLSEFNKLSKCEQNKLIVECINRHNTQTGSGFLDPLISKSYAPHVKDIKNKHGNDTIIKMTIVRTPLSKFLNIAINAASLGDFNKAKSNNQYDDFFHLHLNLTMSTGVKLILEKTEVVNMKVGATVNPNSEVMEITQVPNVTLNQLLDNTQKLMKGKFFTYSASSNNCQYFIRDILTANGIHNQNYHAFVKQDTESIFKGNKFLRKVANSVTDFAATSNNVASKLSTGVVNIPNMGIKSSAKKTGKNIEKTGKQIKKFFGGAHIDYNMLKKKELVEIVKARKKEFKRKINVTGMKKNELVDLLNELD